MKRSDVDAWARYYAELDKHEERIRCIRFFIEHTFEYLKRSHGGSTITTFDNVERSLLTELNQANSMDAPNEPGYFRANND